MFASTTALLFITWKNIYKVSFAMLEMQWPYNQSTDRSKEADTDISRSTISIKKTLHLTWKLVLRFGITKF
jgi:hypothetical protein